MPRLRPIAAGEACLANVATSGERVAGKEGIRTRGLRSKLSVVLNRRLIDASTRY
jgi:hypothetical protein